MADIDGYSKENLHIYIEKCNYELSKESEKIALGKKCTSLIVRFFKFFSPNKNEFYIHKADKEIAGCRDGYLKSLEQNEQWIQPLLSQLSESLRRQMVPQIHKFVVPETKKLAQPECEQLLRAEITYKQIVGKDCLKTDLKGVTDALKAQVAAEFGLPTKVAGQMVDEILGKTDGYQNDLQPLRDLKNATRPEQFYALVHAAGSNELSLVQPETINILKSLASLQAEGQKEQLITRTLAPGLETIKQMLQQHNETIRATEELVKGTTAELNDIEASLSDISERERANFEEASKVSEAVSPKIASIQSELQELQAKGAEIKKKTQGLPSKGLEIESVKKEIRSLEDEKKSLEGRIGVVGYYINFWDNDDMILARKQLADVDNTLSVKQGSLKNLIESERKRLVAHKEADEELSNLATKIMSKQSELTQLTSPGEEHKRQLAVISTERAPLLTKKSELEAQNKEFASQIAQQNIDIKELQSQKATLESTVRSDVNAKDLRAILQDLVALELRAPVKQTTVPPVVVPDPVTTEDSETKEQVQEPQSLIGSEGDKPPTETSTRDAESSESVITDDSETEEFILEQKPMIESEVAKPTEIDTLIQGIKDNPMSLMRFLFPILSPLIPTPDVQKQAKALLEDKAILQTISERVQNKSGRRNAGVLNTVFGIVSSRLNNPAAEESPAAAVKRGMQEATKELMQIVTALKNQSGDIAKSIEDGKPPQLKDNFSPEVTKYVTPALFKFLTMAWEVKNKSKAEAPVAHKVLTKAFTFKGYAGTLGWAIPRKATIALMYPQIIGRLPVALSDDQGDRIKACINDSIVMLYKSGITSHLVAVFDILESYVNDKKMSFATFLEKVSPAMLQLVVLMNKEVVSKWNFENAFTT